MNAYYYRLTSCPTAYNSIPPGWTLVERGTVGAVGIRRTDLPTGNTRHGVVMYRRPLSPEEIEQYRLEPHEHQPTH